MSTLFILDIDGTIAHGGRRFKEAGPEPDRDDKDDYTQWVNTVQNAESLLADKPVPGMRQLAWAVGGTDKLIYVTSREEKWEDITRRWLSIHKFPPAPLIMRPNGDWREGSKLKEDIVLTTLRLYTTDTVVMVDDDEKGTIEQMCHKRGWTFLKARSGGGVVHG